MRSPIAQALVAPPGRLSTPRAGVATPKPLAPQTRFGNLSPGITTNSRFSGGVAPGGGMSMVHPDMPLTFQAPSYAPTGGPVAPHPLMPLLQALQASLPTGATAPGRTAPTGAAAPRPSARTGPGYIVSPPIPGITYGPSGSTADQGPQHLPTVSQSGQSLAALLAAAAQRGTKLPGGYYQQ